MHDEEQRKCLAKTVRETEAEEVSYVVCRAFGLDCSTRSSDDIQMYRGDADRIAGPHSEDGDADDRIAVAGERDRKHRPSMCPEQF